MKSKESLLYKLYSKILQRIPAPSALASNFTSPTRDHQLSSNEDSNPLDPWNQLESVNKSQALNRQGSLRSDFLRQPSIRQTIHPNQRSVGVRIGEYLRKSSYGSRLMANASESLYGQPYLIQPSFPCFSSSGLQLLSYLFLINLHWGISIFDCSDYHFIDFGGMGTWLEYYPSSMMKS
jgi:hypothetical protein